MSTEYHQIATNNKYQHVSNNYPQILTKSEQIDKYHNKYQQIWNKCE